MKRKSEDDRCAKGGLSSRMGIARWNVEASRKLVNRNSPTPLFFVSAAAKGVAGVYYRREGNCVGWKDSEEVRRTTWRASMVCRAPSFPTGPESAIARAAAGRRRNRADLMTQL